MWHLQVDYLMLDGTMVSDTIHGHRIQASVKDSGLGVVHVYDQSGEVTEAFIYLNLQRAHRWRDTDTGLSEHPPLGRLK